MWNLIKRLVSPAEKPARYWVVTLNTRTGSPNCFGPYDEETANSRLEHARVWAAVVPVDSSRDW